MAIVQRAAQPIALHVVGVMVDTEAVVTAHTRAHLIRHPTPHLGVAVVAQAVVVSHAGRNLAHLYRIHLLKFSLLHQSGKRLRLVQCNSLIFVMYSFVMLGETAKKLLKSYTIYSKLLA